jgi:hypothetical protein
MIERAPAPDGGLPAFLAAQARRTPDGPLAIAALAGSGAVILAFWWRGPLWPATITLPLCVAAFGFWGILDRELAERPQASRTVQVTMRTLRLACAIVGFAAGAAILMVGVAATLGRIIS